MRTHARASFVANLSAASATLPSAAAISMGSSEGRVAARSIRCVVVSWVRSAALSRVGISGILTVGIGAVFMSGPYAETGPGSPR